MAFYSIEEAILDLLDQGLSVRQIERRGFAASKVRFVLSTFGSAARHAASDRRRRDGIRRGSAALLAAIQSERRV